MKKSQSAVTRNKFSFGTMRNQKCSQSAIELISILIFVFILIGIIMYVVGLYSLDVQSSSIQKERDDYINAILSEIKLLETVEEGYNREIEIRQDEIDRFNLTIESPYLVIQDMITDPSGEEKYYYEIPGSNIPKIIFNTTLNKTFLIFQK